MCVKPIWGVTMLDQARETALLSVDQIHTYYADSHVLHGISLKIAKGECLALLGRNGAGKSTTLRSIIGLTPIRSGQISFAGQRIDTRPTHKRIRLGLAYVPENRGIFPSLTVAEHLRIAHHAAGAKAKPIAEALELFPRLAERMGNFGSQLSGGEQQMLSLARALIASPDLLILDEPSEGLAPVIVDHITDALNRIKASGVTVLLVEQNLSMAMALADSVAVITQGEIVFSGLPQDLRDNSALMHTHLGVA